MGSHIIKGQFKNNRDVLGKMSGVIYAFGSLAEFPFEKSCTKGAENRSLAFVKSAIVS